MLSQYWHFSIAPSKVIALNLLWRKGQYRKEAMNQFYKTNTKIKQRGYEQQLLLFQSWKSNNYNIGSIREKSIIDIAILGKCKFNSRPNIILYLGFINIIFFEVFKVVQNIHRYTIEREREKDREREREIERERERSRESESEREVIKGSYEKITNLALL